MVKASTNIEFTTNLKYFLKLKFVGPEGLEPPTCGL